MAFTIRTATDYKDCLDQIRQFTQKAFKAGAVTAGGNTGDGTVYSASASENSVAETWALLCTTAGTNEIAKFAVSGSVSGNQAEATAGVPYSIAGVSFVIVAGDTDFAVSDSFTFDVAASTPEWVQDRWDTTDEYELIQHGIGNGADEIYVGVLTKSDSATYWNFELSPFTGFDDTFVFSGQMGYMPEWTRANNIPFQFYVSFSSYAIDFIIIPVEGSHEMGGVGWLNSYASPSQWAYPAYSGGSTTAATKVIGSGGGNYPTGSNLKVLRGDLIRSTLKITPVDYGFFYATQPPAGQTGRLYPASVVDEGIDVFLGELPNSFWPTPYVEGGGLLGALSVMVGSIYDYGGNSIEICGVTFRNLSSTSAGNISFFSLTGD